MRFSADCSCITDGSQEVDSFSSAIQNCFALLLGGILQATEKQKGNHRHKERKREREAAVNAMLLNDTRIFWEQCSFNVTIRLTEKDSKVGYFKILKPKMPQAILL